MYSKLYQKRLLVWKHPHTKISQETSDAQKDIIALEKSKEGRNFITTLKYLWLL